MELKPEIIKRIEHLEEKFGAMGQDITSYLDGLLYADYLTYWDYIHLDTLLTMQNPKTSFPDEKIFIMYHQITELYFKMMLHESGFQSVQYRMIEICSTDFINLVAKDVRDNYSIMENVTLEELFSHIYWRAGATELATGKRTLTLIQFEEKYSKQLIDLATKYKDSNLWKRSEEHTSELQSLRH